MCDNGSRPNILVPTIMRSGTHMLIDQILNNFSAYKGRPLYCDFDKYVREGGDIRVLCEPRGMIIKTHYPQEVLDIDMTVFNQLLLSGVKVITTDRDRVDVIRSLKRSFTLGDKEEVLLSRLEGFNDFWSEVPKLTIPFKALCKPEETQDNVNRIADFIGMSANSKLMSSLGKSDKSRVYLCKLMTRLFGNKALMVNTTIGFAKKIN